MKNFEDVMVTKYSKISLNAEKSILTPQISKFPDITRQTKLKILHIVSWLNDLQGFPVLCEVSKILRNSFKILLVLKKKSFKFLYCLSSLV